MRVASDTTVGTVFTEPTHSMIGKSVRCVPFVNTNSEKTSVAANMLTLHFQFFVNFWNEVPTQDTLIRYNQKIYCVVEVP